MLVIKVRVERSPEKRRGPDQRGPFDCVRLLIGRYEDRYERSRYLVCVVECVTLCDDGSVRSVSHIRDTYVFVIYFRASDGPEIAIGQNIHCYFTDARCS
jgi:hypothetical protein